MPRVIITAPSTIKETTDISIRIVRRMVFPLFWFVFGEKGWSWSKVTLRASRKSGSPRNTLQVWQQVGDRLVAHLREGTAQNLSENIGANNRVFTRYLAVTTP